jgi:hypothetical protein
MKSNQTKNPKAPAKPSITIYPTMELRGALETLAKECDRDLSSQCVAMLKQCVANTKGIA